MNLFPEQYRRSIRLKEYDYSTPGAYFVTICTQNRGAVFGDVLDGKTVLNGIGEIVEKTWFDLPNHIDNIALDEFVIMPNHIHGIVQIVGAGSKPAQNEPPNTGVGAGSKPAHIERTGLDRADIYRAGLEPAPTKNAGLSEIVRQLKTFSARRINKLRNTPGLSVWQRNFYERIIRDEDELNRIRNYIINNPLNWADDKYYTVGAGSKPAQTEPPNTTGSKPAQTEPPNTTGSKPAQTEPSDATVGAGSKPAQTARADATVGAGSKPAQNERPNTGVGAGSKPAQNETPKKHKFKVES